MLKGTGVKATRGVVKGRGVFPCNFLAVVSVILPELREAVEYLHTLSCLLDNPKTSSVSCYFPLFWNSRKEGSFDKCPS